MQIIDYKSRLRRKGSAYAEIDLFSLSELLYFNQINCNIFTGVVFRGQSDSSWVLKPTIDRVLDNKKCRTNRTKKQNEHYSNFEKLFYTIDDRKIFFVENVDNKINDEHYFLWSLGQHYKLATPLLDWSKCFYIAMFFAFYEQNIHGDTCAIFLLDRLLIEKISLHNDQEYLIDLKFIDLIETNTPRVIAQKGLFTRLIDCNWHFGGSIEFWLKEYFYPKRKIEISDEILLLKIFLPVKERSKILQYLEIQKNINDKLLFSSMKEYPEVDKKSKLCNEEFLKRKYNIDVNF